MSSHVTSLNEKQADKILSAVAVLNMSDINNTNFIYK